jgi:hypothetical protein
MAQKKIFVALAFCLSIFVFTGVHAQFRKVPAAVTDAMTAKYPNAKSVEWKDKITVFQATFQLDGADHVAKFNSKGEWQSTEKTIAKDDLPAEVKDGFEKSKYSGWEVRSTSIIYLPENDRQYHLYVEKSDLQKKNLLFNSEGKLLKDSITL